MLCLVTACGGESSSVENKSESFAYSYSVNGCETGKQSFNSLNDYCKGLADDALNNFCASNLRCQTFTNRCENLDLGITCN